jgi:hypothetical protein
MKIRKALLLGGIEARENMTCWCGPDTREELKSGSKMSLRLLPFSFGHCSLYCLLGGRSTSLIIQTGLN